MDEFEVPAAKKLRLDIHTDGAMASVSSPLDDMDDFYDSPSAAPSDAGPTPEYASDAHTGSHQLPISQELFTSPGLNATHEGSGQLDHAAVVIDPASSMHIEPPISTSLAAKHNQEHVMGAVQLTGTENFIADTSLAEVSIWNENVDRRTGTIPENAYDDASIGVDAKLQEISLSDLLGASKTCTDGNFVSVTTCSAMEHAGTIKDEQIQALFGESVASMMVVERSEQTDPQKLAATLSLPDSNTEFPSTSDMDRDISEEGILEGAQVPSDENGHQQLLTESSEPVAKSQVSSAQIPVARQDANEIRGEEAEYELDSSPFESSSDDSSDSSLDSSSDNDYEMLDPAEQARRLMQEDGGSDDDGGRRGAANGPLRTLNEKLDEVVERPDITITKDMLTEELGGVENVVENLVLIRAKTTGEYQVLETGSVLCLKDRTVIGVVAETLGRVQQPLYTVRFTNTAAISEAGISKDTQIYYVPQHSTYVFTQALKAIKGSDASNIHDEEVGDDELEFSDDEAEAEFRRNQKLQRQARRGGRGGSNNGFSRGPQQNISHHPARNDDVDRSNGDTASINYDDAGKGDGLYTPLRRPTNLHEQMPDGDVSSGSRQGNNSRVSRGGRNRGGPNRGRVDRGRGDRGRGRDQIDRSGGTNGYNSHPTPPTAPNLSLPPTPLIPRPPYQMAPPQHPLSSPSFHSLQQGPSYAPQLTHAHSSYGYQTSPPEQHQYPYQQGHQAAYHAPQLPALSSFQAPYRQYGQQSHYPPQHYPPTSSQPTGQCPAAHTVPPIPPGSFVNPAFFGNNYQPSPQQQNFPAQYGGFPPPQQNGYTNGRR